MRKLVIDPVTRIEGHAKIDIFLDDAGRVTDTHFHVTQVRGFEKFTEQYSIQAEIPVPCRQEPHRGKSATKA